MLANLFTQIDKKITAEWDMIEKRKTGVVDDNLTEEMKDESILRQLTYSAVVMLASLLDPQRGGKGHRYTPHPEYSLTYTCNRPR